MPFRRACQCSSLIIDAERFLEALQFLLTQRITASRAAMSWIVFAAAPFMSASAPLVATTLFSGLIDGFAGGSSCGAGANTELLGLLSS